MFQRHGGRISTQPTADFTILADQDQNFSAQFKTVASSHGTATRPESVIRCVEQKELLDPTRYQLMPPVELGPKARKSAPPSPRTSDSVREDKHHKDEKSLHNSSILQSGLEDMPARFQTAGKSGTEADAAVGYQEQEDLNAITLFFVHDAHENEKDAKKVCLRLAEQVRERHPLNHAPLNPSCPDGL